MPMGKIYQYKPKPKKKATTRAVVERVLWQNAEKKKTVEDLTTNFASVSNNWSESCITAIAQGDATTQRDGDSITIKSIKIEGIVTGADVYNYMRLYLAIWDGRSATPLTTNGAGAASDITSTVTAGAGLKRCLMDRYLYFNQLYDGGGTNGHVINYYKRFKKGLKINYTSNVATTGNIKIILGAITDSIAVPNPGFIVGRIVVKFMDI